MAFSCLMKNLITHNTKGSVLATLTRQSLRSTSCISWKNDQKVNKNLLLTPSFHKAIERDFATSTIKLSSDHKLHDHVKIWKVERALSVALLPLIPAALIAPNPVLDTLVAIAIVMHNHWGLEAIVVDYVRPILFGDIGPKIGMGLLYVFTVVSLAGCLNLIYNDIGLANSFLELWKL